MLLTEAADDAVPSLLVLFDLSDSFDTVDHGMFSLSIAIYYRSYSHCDHTSAIELSLFLLTMRSPRKIILLAVVSHKGQSLAPSSLTCISSIHV